MSTIKFNQWLNPDNSENYKCRAWVNFNGTGTVAIRASGNVSSITDNGTGLYTINFTNAFADTNYSASLQVSVTGVYLTGAVSSYTVSSLQLASANSAATLTDATFVNVAIFR